MTNNEVNYRSYTIKPKRDFGSYSFLINGKMVREGFVVTDEHNVNAMPGATWFQTVKDAKKGIDVLVVYGKENFCKGQELENKKSQTKPVAKYSPTESVNNFIIKYEDGTTYACAHTLDEAHKWAEAHTEKTGKTTLVYEYLGLYRKED